MGGKKNVVECTFVKSDVSETTYFATPVRLGVRALACLVSIRWENCVVLAEWC